MQFFKDHTGHLFAFEDDVQVSGEAGALEFKAAHGARLDVPATLTPADPPAVAAPSAAQAAWQQHQGQAAQALRAAEHLALRCFMAGQAFPPAWQSYALALRAIVAAPSGVAAALPVSPALPAGV